MITVIRINNWKCSSFVKLSIVQANQYLIYQQQVDKMKAILMILLFCLAASSQPFIYQYKFIDAADRAIRLNQNNQRVSSSINPSEHNTKLTEQQIQNNIKELQQYSKTLVPRKLAQESIPIVNRPSDAKNLIENLAEPQQISLMPGDDEYEAIKLTLELLVTIFIIIQLCSCICQKKKKRYGQKFEQYVQRSQVEQLDQQNFGEK